MHVSLRHLPSAAGAANLFFLILPAHVLSIPDLAVGRAEEGWKSQGGEVCPVGEETVTRECEMKSMQVVAVGLRVGANESTQTRFLAS